MLIIFPNEKGDYTLSLDGMPVAIVKDDLAADAIEKELKELNALKGKWMYDHCKKKCKGFPNSDCSCSNYYN